MSYREYALRVPYAVKIIQGVRSKGNFQTVITLVSGKLFKVC